MKKTYAIAIDGPAGAGKSTLARQLAAALGFRYVDTGAIYRTVAYHMALMGIGPKDTDGVTRLLDDVNLEIRYDEAGVQHMILNGADVTDEIRTPEMSQAASLISAQKVVREFLLDVQRALARKNNVIMDGRDIGTVVLPQADVKIFLTADVAVRARRRWLELQEKGGKQTMAQVQKDLAQRDLQDSTRAIAPLKQAKDAVVLDTSALDLPASVQALQRIVEEKSGRCRNASKSRQDGGFLLRRPPGSGDGRPGGGSGLRCGDAGADHPQPSCGRGIRSPGRAPGRDAWRCAGGRHGHHPLPRCGPGGL